MESPILQPVGRITHLTFYKHPFHFTTLSNRYSQEKKLSPMSSGEQNNGGDNDDPFECNENAGMREISKWKVEPQLIISAVTSKTQDGNLTDSGANI